MAHTQVGDQGCNSRLLRTAELRVLQVEIVDDFRNGLKSWRPQIATLHENFERAAVSLVSEFALEQLRPQVPCGDDIDWGQ
jgi:hypothetical protein